MANAKRTGQFGAIDDLLLKRPGTTLEVSFSHMHGGRRAKILENNRQLVALRKRDLVINQRTEFGSPISGRRKPFTQGVLRLNRLLNTLNRLIESPSLETYDNHHQDTTPQVPLDYWLQAGFKLHATAEDGEIATSLVYPIRYHHPIDPVEYVVVERVSPSFAAGYKFLNKTDVDAKFVEDLKHGVIIINVVDSVKAATFTMKRDSRRYRSRMAKLDALGVCDRVMDAFYFAQEVPKLKLF